MVNTSQRGSTWWVISSAALSVTCAIHPKPSIPTALRNAASSLQHETLVTILYFVLAQLCVLDTTSERDHQSISFCIDIMEGETFLFQ